MLITSKGYSRQTQISELIKSNSDFAQWENFANWWSCIRKGLRKAWEAVLFKEKNHHTLKYYKISQSSMLLKCLAVILFVWDQIQNFNVQAAHLKMQVSLRLPS